MESHLFRPYIIVELAALALLSALSFWYLDIAGAFSRHMSIHIALMTLVAPVLALLFIQSSHPPAHSNTSHMLLLATAQQLLLFSLWHMPPSVRLAMDSHAGALSMQAVLLFSAVWFWYAVFAQAEKGIWPAVAALLLTGKLFCLVGIILTSAPRVLYAGIASAGSMAISLADQHLAGLLMISFCPLTYVAVAILFISRWFNKLSASNGTAKPSRYIPGNISWPGR